MTNPLTLLRHILVSLHATLRRHRWLLAVIALGAGLRIYGWWTTPIINPDGAYYIFQAKAAYAGHWSAMTGCGVSYISIYPFLIDALYMLVGDWEIAAQMVSLIFGICLLFPIYGLMRQWLPPSTSRVALLVAALNPVLCSRSADVVRGPACWFFMATAMWLLVRHTRSHRPGLSLVVSTLCFLLAAWGRIEALVPMAVALAVLAAWAIRGAPRALAWFSLPLIGIGIAGAIGAMVSDLPVDQWSRSDELLLKFKTLFAPYAHVTDSLAAIGRETTDPLLRQFLPEAKNSIWLIGLGTLANRILEAVFYPFVPLFFIGLTGIGSRLRQDPRWWFPLAMSAAGLILLYAHLLQVWILEYRFIMLIMIPAMPFAALGVDRVLGWLSRWKALAPRWVVPIAVMALLVAGLPKNLSPRDPEKIVFRQIGEAIARRMPPDVPAAVSTSPHTQLMVSFYANKRLLVPHCHSPATSDQWQRFGADPTRMAADLHQRGIDFFLWESRHWSLAGGPPQSTALRRLGQWFHPDTGDMVLFQVLPLE